MDESVSSKICLVTGASSGIGKATAIELAKREATVVMLCRDHERGEAALLEVKKVARTESVQLMFADLASQSAIRKFATDFRQRHDRLHVLINNAGLQLWDRSVTDGGIETTFAVNYLAPFLLTNLLLDLLKASTPSRIVNVCSMVHKWASIDFEDLQEERNYRSKQAYGQSKLALLLFSYELARRLNGSGVTVNAMEPGMVRTDFARDFRGFYRLMARLWRPFMKSPEKGAETVVYLAASPEVEGITGKYFRKNRPISSSALSYDVGYARRLWGISAELTSLSTGMSSSSGAVQGAERP